MPYIVVSNLTVEPVKVISNDGTFSIIELLGTGGRIQLRNTKIYETRDEAEAKISRRKPSEEKQTSGAGAVHKSPYDYEMRPWK